MGFAGSVKTCPFRCTRPGPSTSFPLSPARAKLRFVPELAEVEYYRKRWNCGLQHEIVAVKLHPDKRIFRSVPTRLLQKRLPGTVLTRSESRGKQMLFQFSPDLWMGLHLGMTGELLVETPGFRAGKHDHLVLFQRERALVFRDPRQFGRVRTHFGSSEPDWWAKLPPAVDSPAFKRPFMAAFLQRHGRLPIKAALLLQAGFPGIGNWMADEILWRARIHPQTLARNLSPDQMKALWRDLRFVCRGALRSVANDFSDPPMGWLFHERWTAQGRCPIHKAPLRRATVGGRTTAWCEACQGGTEWVGPSTPTGTTVKAPLH